MEIADSTLEAVCGGGPAVVSRTSMGWIGALHAVCISCACAAPADDHQRGLKAYREGDVATAIHLLRAPAGAGHAASQSLLAFILDNADFAAEALPLYRAAAAQGDADAHAGLANLYLLGRGISKDEKRALAHFSKAAELGHAASIEVMVLAWRNGSFGLAPDPAQAAAWQARADAQRAAAAAAKPRP